MSLERCQSAPLTITEDAPSTSSQEQVEDTPMETNDTPTKMRQGRTETPLDSKKPLTDEEDAKKRRINYVFQMLNSDICKAELRYKSCKACKSRWDEPSRPIPEKCPNCVKVFDDIVRQVHADLLSGKLVMVGITRTRTAAQKTRNQRVQTSPRMGHCSGCQCHVREEDRTYHQDFSGGTLSANQCQCQRCKDEGNSAVWVRLGKETSGATHSRWQKIRPAPYSTRRAHTPCEDEALKDLHNHVLAGDQNLPGETFIKVLGSLHGQGPCRKDCKLKADVAWMKKRVPKQVGTQTCLTRDVSVQTAPRMPRALRNQATQAHLQSSVGIQKGACLARVRAAKASWHRTSAIQVCMPELSHTHRPVGKVVGVQSRI